MTASSRKKPPEMKFPLTLHRASGQWSKCFTLPDKKRKTVYFGTDPHEALRQYLDERLEWQVGKNPRLSASGNCPARTTVGGICEAYLAAQRTRLAAGEIRPRTLYEQESICERLKSVLGENRVVANLTAGDFEKLKGEIASTNSPRSVSQLVNKSKVPFVYAWEADLLMAPVKFGPTFRGPGLRSIRQQQNARPSLLYEPHQLRHLVEAADPLMKACILLGLNGAYGAADIATLPRDAVQLKKKWLTHERAKTAIQRHCPLWPETVEAIVAALALRPESSTTEFENLAFLSSLGTPLVNTSNQGTRVDTIGRAFRRLLRETNLYRRGVGFYALRHCFRTAADTLSDTRAVNLIMGHVGSSRDMSEHYVHHIEPARLIAVTEHVRQWLYKKAAKRAA